MAFISISEHEKFVRLFQSFIPFQEDTPSAIDESVEVIRADISRLQTILLEYKETVSQLEELSQQYKTIMQRAKANLRKRQAILHRQQSKLFTARR